MKKVRQLVRVSSNQQLDKDGDLKVQKKVIAEYVATHEDWILEGEYFEGGVSAYKNTAAERKVLQRIERDAKNREFDILVAYKDDRIGRLMDDTPAFIMRLKKYNVDVYTAKDGCLTPPNGTPEELLQLLLRFFTAHKSSADTAVRVKDTAERLIEDGKFMGGKAPYGYNLVESGEISKHKRLLLKLVIDPERAEVVKYIYHLSYDKEYGSAKIATVLNNHSKYSNMAPNDVWKGGTITSILTNPIYAGYIVYKRRERKDDKYHRLDSKDWIFSKEKNEELVIIDEKYWFKVQEKRKLRGAKYTKTLEHQDVNVISRNDGNLPLIDVLYCAECDHKMVNGSKYDYWTIKSTGERRASKKPIYKCHQAWQGVPHKHSHMYRADRIEPIVFSALSEYIGRLLEREDIYEKIKSNQQKGNKALETNLEKERQKLENTRRKIQVLRNKILDCEINESLLGIEDLQSLLNEHKENEQIQLENLKKIEEELEKTEISSRDWEEVCTQIPTWQDVFMNAENQIKRVLVNKLIKRIRIQDNEMKIYFRINLNDFFLQPRMTEYDVVPQSRL